MRSNKDYSYYRYDVGRYEPYVFDSDETKKNFTPYKEDTKHLVWNVITTNGVFNVFGHYRFCQDLIEAKKKYGKNYIKFANQIRSDLSYYYGSKCEWEIEVSDLFHGIERDTLKELQKEFDDHPTQVRVSVPIEADKIDVYTQVMLNWDRFIHYLWDNMKLITAKKLGISKEK